MSKPTTFNYSDHERALQEIERLKMQLECRTEEREQLTHDLNTANMNFDNLAEQYRWIPVTERLPEIDRRYGEIETLVHMDDGFISTAAYARSGWELWAEAGEVTHWMPLPPPPKEEKNDNREI